MVEFWAKFRSIGSCLRQPIWRDSFLERWRRTRSRSLWTLSRDPWQSGSIPRSFLNCPGILLPLYLKAWIRWVGSSQESTEIWRRSVGLRCSMITWTTQGWWCMSSKYRTFGRRKSFMTLGGLRLMIKHVLAMGVTGITLVSVNILYLKRGNRV